MVATKSKTSKPKTHPTYFEMIKDAIVTLKERTGSSQYAIAKHIEEKQSKANTLPSNFKKILLVQLRNLVASGKLVKVKNSFKLSPDQKKQSPKPAAASKKPETAASKKSSTAGAVKAKPTVKKTEKKAAKPKSAGAVKKPRSLKSPSKRMVAVKKAKK